MKKILTWMVIMLGLVCKGNAQNEEVKRAWHWYFGDHSGLDFSSGNALADTTGSLNTGEGCASISDTSGNLLFYSDGRTVWNRLHQVMPNGTGLMGGILGSSTQEALMIPKPLSPNIYYLFTTDEAPGINGMRYSVIDMNLDTGNGDIDIAQKNILLFAPCTEKLSAVNHCDNNDIWVMGHETNNNHFRAYLVTANGIDTNAIVSAVGFPMIDSVTYSIFGVLKFSPNGKKLCTATDSSARRVQLYDFDNYSGQVSNSITLNTEYNFVYGICFSPDNSKLYLGTSAFAHLYQYDVSINDSATIIASKLLIYEGTNYFRYMQNGSDGKIYLEHGACNDTLMSSIDNPNGLGSLCNLNLFSTNPLRPYHCAGLPNFNESYFNQSPPIECSTSIQEFRNVFLQISPNPAITSLNITYIIEHNATLTITNAYGSTVKQLTLYPYFKNRIVYVDDLAEGIYLVTMREGNKISSKKIIVER